MNEDSSNDIETAVERLKVMLTNRATGGTSDPGDYAQLREEVLRHPVTRPLVPKFVNLCRNMDEWWNYIKPQFGSYVERREFVREQFEPMQRHLEELRRTEESASATSEVGSREIPELASGDDAASVSAAGPTVTHNPDRDSNAAIGEIDAQIQKARSLVCLSLNTREEVQLAKNAYNTWKSVCQALLADMLPSQGIATRFVNAGIMRLQTDVPQSEYQRAEFAAYNAGEYQDVIGSKVAILEAAREIILIRGRTALSTNVGGKVDCRKVFVVHGSDNGPKEAVARLLEKLGLSPIILHEQPSKGQTLIDKFENHADVGFAAVLMTPDDVGSLNQPNPELVPRARQNVVLELGYFVGKLGRERVCVLRGKDVELPSDMLGVVYIDLDASGGWRANLGRELKAVGFDVDLNRLA